MYILLQNNQLLLGPVPYNKKRFESTIEDDLDISITLPTQITEPYTNEEHDIDIYPVINQTQESFNPKTQRLNGPFWTFTEAGAIANYVAEDLPVDAVKNMLKDVIADQRWRVENAGVDILVGGETYTFPTDKTTRADLNTHINAGTVTVNFKINREVIVSLSQTDLVTVLSEIMGHVQAAFDWELSKFSEIDACESLTELDSVELIHPNNSVGTGNA